MQRTAMACLLLLPSLAFGQTPPLFRPESPGSSVIVPIPQGDATERSLKIISSAGVTSPRFLSNVATGTAPFVAASTTASDINVLKLNGNASSFYLDASNLASGTLPAGRFPALTGDITTTAGSLTTVIGSLKVTNAMLAGSIDPTKVTGTAAILGANTFTGLQTVNAKYRIGTSTVGVLINSDLGGVSETADDNVLYVATQTGAGTAMFDKYRAGLNDGAGLILRMARGTAAAPINANENDQFGYLDMRAYSGTKFFQCISIAGNIDGPFTSGQAPPSRLIFATNVANGGSTERVRLDKNGYFYINTTAQAVFGTASYLTVKSTQNDWSSVIHAAPASGAGYALRLHTNDSTSSSYGLAISSGAGAGTINFSVLGNGNVSCTGSSLSTSSTGGVGYNTGAGGSVTQITSRTTSVTINKVTGSITTDTTALAALGTARFTVNNSTVAIGDTIVLSIRSGTAMNWTKATVHQVTSGSFDIVLHNSAAASSETGAIIINFAVIRGVTS